MEKASGKGRPVPKNCLRKQPQAIFTVQISSYMAEASALPTLSATVSTWTRRAR